MLDRKKKSIEFNCSEASIAHLKGQTDIFFSFLMWFIHFAVAVTRQGKVYRVLVLSVSNLSCIFNHCVVVIVSCASFVRIEARIFFLWLISKLRLPVH